MSKNAIVQFHINPDIYKITNKSSVLNKSNEQIFNYSKKSFEIYCDKYGIDYILVTSPKVNYVHPTWERLDFWLNKEFWLNSYENICYVDTDVFALPNSSNIFSYSKKDHFSRIPYWKANKPLEEGSIFKNTRFKDTCFQAGVILLNEYVIEKTLHDILNYKDLKFSDDSVLLNYAIANSDVKVYNIPETFNVKYSPTIDLSKINFTHAFGNYKVDNTETFLKTLKSIYGT